MSNSDLPGTGGDIAMRVDGTDEDVEGHRMKDVRSGFNPDAPRPGEGVRDGAEGSDEDDVEGHLYRLGPTTEGEFSKRGPGDNPNGDR